MTIGTVCSGIGAPEVAFDAKPLWFSEIEKFPSAVLAHHYPDVPNLGDFTTDEAIEYMVSNPPDVFIGGTPCQAFSVAGKRQSLDDDRGNLTLVFTEVWHRLRAAGTKYCVWENVPGVLNTKDNAFGCFISAMVGADTIAVDGRWASAGLVSGQEGVIAWRTLDAQYFGVPQRRRRVFAVIGHPGDFSVAEILFKPESLFGHTEEGRETRQDAAGGVGASTFEASVYENHPNDSRVKGPLEVCEQLTARNGTGGGNLPLVQEAEIMNTIDAHMNAKYGSDQWVAQKHYVFEPIPIHDQATRHSGKRGASQDGKGNGLGVGKSGDCSPTITSGDKHAVAYPIDTRNALRDPEKQDAVNRQGVGTGEDGDPSATVTSAHVNAVAFNWQSGGDVRHNPSASGTDALTAHQTPAVQNSGMAVRRLTPVECERLQGFPEIQDEWEFIGCIDQAKNCANVEVKNRKLQRPVLNAEKTELQQTVQFAENNSQANCQQTNKPVLVNVLINYEAKSLEIHRSDIGLFWSANIAENKSESQGLTKTGDFVHQSVLTLITQAKTIHSGRVELRTKDVNVYHHLSGSKCAERFGRNINASVSDAVTSTTTQKKCMKFTTSQVGLNFQSCDMTLTTLFCSAMTAISGCIPEIIKDTNLFCLKVVLVSGFTRIPWRNKSPEDCPDGPRYKAIGNSMAIPVVKFIADRIKEQLK